MNIVNVIKLANPYTSQGPDGNIIKFYYNYDDTTNEFSYIIDVKYEDFVYRFNISKDIFIMTDKDGKEVFSQKRGGSQAAIAAVTSVFDLNNQFRLYGPGMYTPSMMKRILDHAFVATGDPSIKKMKRLLGKRFAKQILARIVAVDIPLRNKKEIHKVIHSVLKTPN